MKRRRTGSWGRWHRLPGLPDLGVEGGTVTRRWPVVDGRVRLVRWSGPVPVVVSHQHNKERSIERGEGEGDEEGEEAKEEEEGHKKEKKKKKERREDR